MLDPVRLRFPATCDVEDAVLRWRLVPGSLAGQGIHHFVDAPETDLGYRDRVQEQADYFGITLEQSMEAGNMASEFVLTKLKEEGFTIITRWQHVFSGYYPDRIYGFVTVGDRDLGELLVENGLGRIHGQKVWGLTEPVRERLAELEEEAKAEGRGAWGFERHASLGFEPAAGEEYGAPHSWASSSFDSSDHVSASHTAPHPNPFSRAWVSM
jgi:hypothetical protein